MTCAPRAGCSRSCGGLATHTPRWKRRRGSAEDDLIKWVREEQMEEPELCQRFIEFVSRLSKERSPLLPMDDLADVSTVLSA